MSAAAFFADKKLVQNVRDRLSKDIHSLRALKDINRKVRRFVLDTPAPLFALHSEAFVSAVLASHEKLPRCDIDCLVQYLSSCSRDDYGNEDDWKKEASRRASFLFLTVEPCARRMYPDYQIFQRFVRGASVEVFRFLVFFFLIFFYPLLHTHPFHFHLDVKSSPMPTLNMFLRCSFPDVQYLTCDPSLRDTSYPPAGSAKPPCCPSCAPRLRRISCSRSKPSVYSTALSRSLNRSTVVLCPEVVCGVLQSTSSDVWHRYRGPGPKTLIRCMTTSVQSLFSTAPAKNSLQTASHISSSI